MELKYFFRRVMPVLKLVFMSLLALSFGCAALPVMSSAASDDDPAYGARRRPYSCFMKAFGAMTKGDFKRLDGVSALLSKNALSVEEAAGLNECGRAVYEKYGARINTLINNFDADFGAKAVLPTEAQYSSARLDDETIDFSYTRSLARSLIAAGRYLETQKRHGEALKLYSLVWRFGQIVMSGDGQVPSLIMAMIGIAVKNIAAENNLARALLAGDFDAKFYEDYSAALMAKLDDEMDMKAVMNCERRLMINVLEYEVFVAGRKSGDFADVVSRIPQSRMEEAKAYTIGIFNDCYDSVGVWLTRHASEPDVVAENMKKLSQEISERGQPSLWSIVSPIKAVGDILLAIAMPNFSRAYEQFLRARYYPYGAAVLSRVLAGVKRGGHVPRTLEEVEDACGFKLQKDFFNRSRGPLVYKPVGDEFVLYSFGMNYQDDNASEKDDIVMFRIRKNLK